MVVEVGLQCRALLHPDTGDKWCRHANCDRNTHHVHQDTGEGKATFTGYRRCTDFILWNFLPTDNRENDWACSEEDDGTEHHPVGIHAEGAERVHREVCKNSGSGQEGAVVHRCKRKDSRDEVADAETIVFGLQRKSVDKGSEEEPGNDRCVFNRVPRPEATPAKGFICPVAAEG